MKRILLIAMALCFTAYASLAATQAGSTEVGVAGSIQRTTVEVDGYDAGGGSSSISAQLVSNQFMSDAFSMGLTMRISSSVDDENDDGSGGATSSQLFLLGRGDLYLAPGADVVPYFGGHAGIISYTYDSGGRNSTETSDATVTIGAQGGFKVFLSESTSWNVELDVSTYEQAGATGPEVTIKVMSLFLGMSYYF